MCKFIKQTPRNESKKKKKEVKECACMCNSFQQDDKKKNNFVQKNTQIGENSGNKCL